MLKETQEAMEKAQGSSTNADTGLGSGIFGSVLGGLSEFFQDKLTTPLHYANLAQFAIASSKESGNLHRTFFKYQEAGKLNWPNPEGLTINPHAEVKGYMSRWGEMCGTTPEDAKWTRGNW